MRVLVTGSNGFIGKNLISCLQEKENIDIIPFDIDTPFSLIEENIKEIDFIYHLAGINRPKDNNDFKENSSLTKKIIDLLIKNNLKTPFLLSSSTQAILDNDYGKSKKEAEDIVFEYGKNAPVYVYRLNNVFGKWCKPNYNSVVATFCHNIANDLDITITDKRKELKLIYIDDIVNDFLSLLDKKDYTNKVLYIKPIYKITLGELANKLYYMKECMQSISVPETGDEFTKKLFSTFVSYYPKENMAFSAKMNIDDRGSFTELVRTLSSGQFSVSVTHPGITRGNHYHHTKMERFILVKGTAKITFEHVLTHEKVEFIVDENDIKIVTIPVGYTHNIENIGNTDMVLILWCNELFDKNRPDTFYKPIQ